MNIANTLGGCHPEAVKYYLFYPLWGMLTFKLLLFSFVEFLLEPIDSLPGGWSRARGCAQEEGVVWGREAEVLP